MIGRVLTDVMIGVFVLLAIGNLVVFNTALGVACVGCLLGLIANRRLDRR